MPYSHSNLKEGETVLLDVGFSNCSEVVILNFSNNKMFAHVKSAGTKVITSENCWDVMTNRLTRIK